MYFVYYCSWLNNDPCPPAPIRYPYLLMSGIWGMLLYVVEKDFVDGTKLRVLIWRDYPELSGWILNRISPIFTRERNGRKHRQRRERQRWGWCGHQPGIPAATRSWKRHETCSPLSLWRERDLADTLMSRPVILVLDFWVSRTVREYISVALSLQICGDFLQQPQEINTVTLLLTLTSCPFRSLLLLCWLSWWLARYFLLSYLSWYCTHTYVLHTRFTVFVGMVIHLFSSSSSHMFKPARLRANV